MKSDIEVQVMDLARGGAGVARDEQGRVVFVPFSAPGDRLKVRVLEESKRYAQGEIIEVLTPSPVRQEPPCPVFGVCGGCQWQHLPYELQWKTKFQGALQALKRVQVEAPESLDLIPATQLWEYRNRVQMRGDKGKIGFFRRGSQELVAVDRCAVARPEINRVLEQVQMEGARFGGAYKVEIEVLPSGEVRRIWNSRHAAEGFRQVHDEQNERLKQWVTKEIGACDVLLDLYGGSGNLSFPLVDYAQEIHCVDLSVPKKRPVDAPGHLHFHHSSVFKWVKQNASSPPWIMQGGQNISAVLDPPREGLGKEFAEIADAVEKLKVQHLVTVGCDPDSWAKDVSRWVRRGWVIQKIMVLDLFPQTPHVEAVASLRWPKKI